MRWLAICSVLATCAAGSIVGCATLRPDGSLEEVRTSPPPPRDRSADPDLIEGSAASTLSDARERLLLADAAFDDSLYEEARDQYDRALSVLLEMEMDDEVNRQIAADHASLVEELCLARIRVSRVLRPAGVPVARDEFDLPIEYNTRVERWMQFYVTNGRATFAGWLARSGRYVEMMRSAMESEGLPQDLAFLPLVESGYNPNAYSRARAVGIWQFISSTGKLAGLESDAWVDERRDPEKATRAAARHLKDLYEEFGSWSLALAAYNAGQARVMQAIAAAGTDNFWDLSLPSETMDYVPRVYAAIIIAKDPEAFGFPGEYEIPHRYDEVTFERATDLKTIARLANTTADELTKLNPELINGCTPPERGYTLRVPEGSMEGVLAALAGLPEDERHLSEAEVRRRAERYTWITYRVRPGDTLSGIAQRYRTTVSKLRGWNPKARGKYIRPGDRLRIYSRRTS